jgi:ATP/maltotriose-dependent transcriptional regulator MalT
LNQGAEAVVIAIGDCAPGLADRLAALLADLPGVRLAEPGETPDAVLVAPADTPGETFAVALTQRELEVLGLLAEGASNKVIAHRLGISVHTVKFHVCSLFDKLDAIGRTDAVAQAARLGVIQL